MMDIYERIGEFLQKLALLTAGGCIIGEIMREDKNTSTIHLYVIGAILIFILFFWGLFLFMLDKKSKRKE